MEKVDAGATIRPHAVRAWDIPVGASHCTCNDTFATECVGVGSELGFAPRGLSELILVCLTTCA